LSTFDADPSDRATGAPRLLGIGTPGPMRQRLNALILAREKRATAGLAGDYVAEGEPLEHVGERLTLVDDEGERVATVVVTKVVTCRFIDVPWEFARAEAEGDESIEEWREGHREYWTSVGEQVDDSTTVVLIWFELE